MCTAVYADHRYFGRTLDHTCSYGEEMVLAPRNFPLPFRQVQNLDRHHGILGMAHVAGGYPLYYDAMNEHGLCMAGLNFEGFARYGGPGRDQVAAFELIPWILGRCADLREARELLKTLSITDEDFSPALPAAQLHWLLADRKSSVTVEATAQGLRVWENSVGVLTNAPPFDDQMRRLADFMQLSSQPPRNLLSDAVDLMPYSRGMGAMGLPGDLSSQSRFVRASFTKLNALPGGREQFFHILDTVRQTRGCCRMADGAMEYTLYSSCCDMEDRIYCCTTWGSRRICGIDMNREDLSGKALLRWPLLTREDILLRN